MTKRRKIVSVLFGVLLLAGFAFLFFRGKAPQPPPPKGELNLLETVPPQGKTQTLHPTTGILFNFDDLVIASSANVVVEPNIPLIIETGTLSSKSLVIRPKEQWQFNTKYIIVIKKGLSSINNKELKQDISYEIEFEAPSDIMSF